MSLAEATKRGIIDRMRCVYVMASGESVSLKEALQLDLIRGKLITMCELRWILNDYARRFQPQTQHRLTTSMSTNHVE